MMLLFLTTFIPLWHLACGGGAVTPTGPASCTPTGKELCEAARTASCTPTGKELCEAAGPASCTPTGEELGKSDQFLTGLDNFCPNALYVSQEMSTLSEKGPVFWSTIQDETRERMEKLIESASSVWETTEYPVVRDRTVLEDHFSKVDKQKKELREWERQFKRNKHDLLKRLQQRDAALHELPASIQLNIFLVLGQVRVVNQFTDSLIEHLKAQGGKNAKIVSEEELAVRKELFHFASTVYRLEGTLGGLAALARSKHPADKAINSAIEDVSVLLNETTLIIRKLTGNLKEDWAALLAGEKHRPKLFHGLGPAVLMPEIAASLREIVRSVNVKEFPLSFVQVYEEFLKITASVVEISEIALPAFPHASSSISAELSTEERVELSAIYHQLEEIEMRLAASIRIVGRLPDNFRQADHPFVASHNAETAEVMAQALSLLQNARPWQLSGFLVNSPAVRLARWINTMYVLNHPKLCPSTAEKLAKISSAYNSSLRASATPYPARLLQLVTELQHNYLKSVSLNDFLRSHFYLLTPGVTCDKCTEAAAAISQALPFWYLSLKKITQFSFQLEMYHGEPLGEVIEAKQAVKNFYRSIVEVEEAAIHAMTSIWGSGELVLQLECFIKLFPQIKKMIDMVDIASLVVRRGAVAIQGRDRPAMLPLPQEYQLFKALVIA